MGRRDIALLRLKLCARWEWVLNPAKEPFKQVLRTLCGPPVAV